MEGGVAFFLLLILLVVAVGFGIVLYATGGALLGTKPDADDDEPRPVHKHATSPTEEKVRLAGTGADEDERSST